MDYTNVPGSATAYRRQKQIEDCLLENLRHRPYPSVSISDLCHQLGISRKSFYNYFPDKDSCFRSIIRRKLHVCFLTLTANVSESSPVEDLIACYLTYWQQEKEFLNIVVRNNLVQTLMDQCIHFIQVENQILLPYLNTPQLKADAFVLSAFISTQITLVLQWHLKNYETPLEDMVRTYKRLIYQPLLNLE